MNEKIVFESKKSKLSTLFGCLLAAIQGAFFNVALALLVSELIFTYCSTFAILFVVFYILREAKIVVTDKRIYGTAVFGKRVDLPLSSVSSVGFGLFRSIIIKTPSGRFVFTNLKKRKEIYKVISDLLMNRQPTQHTPATIVSEAEELNNAKASNDTGVLAHKEYRKRCNVCGHIFCYTDKDIEENEKNEKRIKSARNRAVISAFAGTTIQADMETANADRMAARIKDFNRCSKCNSTDLSEITEEEFAKVPFAAPDTQAHTSSADELKKFKELLDMGAITQEEFDAKKKQLLGL